MADDASWGDFGCFGSELIRTPNVDRLAGEGARFTCCYSGSTVCAPARSSLMQGLHQGHATVRNNASPGGYRHALQPEDTTVTEVLQGAGFRTSEIRGRETLHKPAGAFAHDASRQTPAVAGGNQSQPVRSRRRGSGDPGPRVTITSLNLMPA